MCSTAWVCTLFVPWEQGERDLVLSHLPHLQPGDIGLLDVGLCCLHELWAEFIAQRRQLSAAVRAAIQRHPSTLCRRLCRRSVVVTLEPSPKKRAAVRHAGLFATLITVRVATGGIEVLATNLLDETLYPTAEFGELYHHRWGIETYYGLVKAGWIWRTSAACPPKPSGRMSRRRCSSATGIPPDPARPGGAAAAAGAAPASRASQPRGQFSCAQKPHHPTAAEPEPTAQVLPKLHRLFLDNPVSHRPNRAAPRRKRSGWRSYYYQRSIKKSVF